MGLAISRLVKMLFARKEMRIVMVGLQDAGKTTILRKLRLGEIGSIPQPGFVVETVEYKDVSFTVWDVGQDKSQYAFPHYQKTQGLIFVIDSSNRQRITEARNELRKMLNKVNLRETALLVFANKQDRPSAMRVSEITDKLELASMETRNWFVQGSCAITGEGIFEGLDWLSSYVSTKG